MYVYACVYICMYVHLYISAFICMQYVHMHACKYVIYGCMCLCMNVFMIKPSIPFIACTYKYIYAHTCMHIRIHVRRSQVHVYATYIHTYIHTTRTCMYIIYTRRVRIHIYLMSGISRSSYFVCMYVCMYACMYVPYEWHK